MKLILSRISSTLIVGAWVGLAGARLMLDIIGYSTAPEDIEVARTRLDQFLEWLLSIPWWVLLGLTALLTVWWIWLSWPRQSMQAVPDTRQQPLADRSVIRLHYRAGDHTPELLSQENIWRYYSLKSGVKGMKEDGTVVEYMTTSLFLVYDRPTKDGNLRVRFLGTAMPYEVKDFGSRHAVVCFTDTPTDITIELSTY